MRYGILGPLEVLDDDGRAVDPGQTERQLLAMLLLHPGEAISTDRLAEAMWGDDLPANPQNALQARVSRLRKLLGRDTIATLAPGYAIVVDVDTIDAVRFEQLLAAARTTDDAQQRFTLYTEALDLWRGAALADLAHKEFAIGEAGRLERLRLDAVEGRIDASLDMGHHAEVTAELQALAIDHPLREGVYRRLMLALYRDGRQAEALRVYRDARQRLGEELGIEPGPELVALEEAILLQDPALSPPLPPSGDVFPAPLTSFVGRTSQLENVAEGLERSRLVTLLGPGGVGKTRLAIEAVGSLDTERGFVDLASVTSPDMVVSEVAGVFRIDRGRGGFGAPSAPVDLEPAVVAHLNGRKLVLVLDNCEHVVDEVARLVETLLLRLPELRVVATSRERLGVPGEVVLPVPPLAVAGDGDDVESEAASLFIERARNVDPAFDPAPVAEVIADICVRLDGIPLAIELAAARTRSLPVPAIAARLDDRFRLLSGGSRTAIARQRTLRAAIDWSHHLLEERERVVFRRIAILAGPFGLTAAEAIAGGDGIDTEEVFDVLDRLADQSMVVPLLGPEPRFRLLENVRAYGRDQLAEATDGDRTVQRMIDFYADFVDTSEPQLRTGEQILWMERLGAEYDNIAAALDLAWDVDTKVAVRTIGRLGWYWYLRGMFDEASRWLVRAAGADLDGEERAMAEVYFATAMVSLQRPEAVPAFTKARTYAERSGHWFIEALCRATMAAFGMEDDAAASLDAISEARKIFAEHGDDWGVALTFFLTAVGPSENVRESVEIAEEARRGFDKVGDGWGVGYAEYILASCYRVLGEYDRATELFAASRENAQRVGVLNEVPNIPTELANVAVLRGDYETAARHVEEALVLSERYPWGAAEASAANAAGFLARRTGRFDEAIAHHMKALSIYREFESPPGEAYSVSCLGCAEALAGNLDLAESHHREGLELAGKLQQGVQRDLSIAFALEGLAEVAAARDDAVRTATLLGAAHRLRADQDLPLPPGEDFEAVQARDTAIAAIGDNAYAEAFAAGETTSWEDIERS